MFFIQEYDIHYNKYYGDLVEYIENIQSTLGQLSDRFKDSDIRKLIIYTE